MNTTFYLCLLRLYKLESVLLLLSGLFYRLLNLVVFILIIKVFLVVIEPSISIPKIKYIFSSISSYSLANVDDKGIILILLVVLQIAISVHFCIGRINLKMFLRAKRLIGLELGGIPVDETLAKRRLLILETIPLGYENVIKIGEIVFFFILMLVLVFWLNVLVGLSVMFMIPFFMFYMMLKGKRDLVLTNEYRDSKIGLNAFSEKQYAVTLQKGSVLLAYKRKNLIFFQFLAGTIIALIIALFFIFEQGLSFTGIWGILFVFGIRYIVSYARELSAIASKVLSARVVLNSVADLGFKKMKSVVDESRSVNL